jgi:hypothetical protein
MSLNPATWPLAAKIISVGACALVAASGVTYAVATHPGSAAPSPAATSVPLSRASSPLPPSPISLTKRTKRKVA